MQTVCKTSYKKISDCVQNVCKTMCKLCADCVQTVCRLCADCTQTVCRLYANCVQSYVQNCVQSYVQNCVQNYAQNRVLNIRHLLPFLRNPTKQKWRLKVKYINPDWQTWTNVEMLSHLKTKKCEPLCRYMKGKCSKVRDQW